MGRLLMQQVYGVILQWTAVLHCLMAVPNPPANLTLDGIYDSAAVVVWQVSGGDDVVGFEMTVRPLLSTLAEIRQQLAGHRRSVVVQPLYPGTEYQIYLSSRNMDGTSNVSDVITFRTLEASAKDFDSGAIHVNPGEVIVVAFILVAWICAIAAFLHKWGKIRILQSPETRYNHTPKNLHTVKVVKRSTDSVIYKNYTKEVSTTMIARQKRFERMHTMPNIKINTADILAAQSESSDDGESKKDDRAKKARHKHKVFSRTITSPVLELDEDAASSSA